MKNPQYSNSKKEKKYLRKNLNANLACIRRKCNCNKNSNKNDSRGVILTTADVEFFADNASRLLSYHVYYLEFSFH